MYSTYTWTKQHTTLGSHWSVNQTVWLYAFLKNLLNFAIYEYDTLYNGIKSRFTILPIQKGFVKGAVVVAQLVERLLPIPEVYGLNPVFGKNLYWTFTVNCIEKTKIKKKEAENCPFIKILKRNHEWGKVVLNLFTFKVILKEGWTFNWVHTVNHSYLIKTKLIIYQPIDVTSHLYGWSNDSL